MSRPDDHAGQSVTALGQYMTPCWAAHALWEAYFPDVKPNDKVIEPTCGDGRMLAAVPQIISATGVELDPGLAAAARVRNPHRMIHQASFLDVDLPEDFTIAFGNPPFEAKFIDRMLDKLSNICVLGARAGFIAPAYFMQTPSRVIRWNRRWSVACELLPRTIFARLSKPLVFVVFTADPLPNLRGMRLYYEAEAVSALCEEANREMCEGTGTWRQVVANALAGLGGVAHLRDIYDKVRSRRPTENQYWQEKIRQTLQRHFTPHGGGVWSV